MYATSQPCEEGVPETQGGPTQPCRKKTLILPKYIPSDMANLPKYNFTEWLPHRSQTVLQLTDDDDSE